MRSCPILPTEIDSWYGGKKNPRKHTHSYVCVYIIEYFGRFAMIYHQYVLTVSVLQPLIHYMLETVHRPA